MDGTPISPQNGEQGWHARARFTESGSGAGFTNAVEPGQTDRSDKPVPGASRWICARLVGPSKPVCSGSQAHWQTGYVIEIGEKFSMQVQVTDGCTGLTGF